MGLIRRILGGGGVSRVGEAVSSVAEVFIPNATRDRQLGHDAFVAALGQSEAEFARSGRTVFDSFVNGLNRLPRPFLALGTLGLFAFSMIDPVGFTERMEGLAYVPDPLWWLLGAIVSFYFGARELHYRRATRPPVPKAKPAGAPRPSSNAALAAWRAERGG